jgi:hypothetical protein
MVLTTFIEEGNEISISLNILSSESMTSVEPEALIIRGEIARLPITLAWAGSEISAAVILDKRDGGFAVD